SWILMRSSAGFLRKAEADRRTRTFSWMGDAMGSHASERQKLGEILEQLELITGRQLQSALETQTSSGLKLGDLLVAQGVLAMEERDFALAVQGGAEGLGIRDI